MTLIETTVGILLFAIIVTLPGYFLTLAFFPRRADLDGIERLVFSFVFSISFLPLLMLIENQLLGIAINYFSTLASLLVLVIFALLVYLIRVQRISAPAALYKLFPKVAPNEAASVMPLIKK
ncbi:MAG: DUF1616 domain-containing protein [Candidatus Diapherotrites archaeon]|nr:DUF1616 domain-containing protein [Candidatus Micrarchaeota archaeon]MBU1939308.1 DUF1616 domain-containing protein [Candidatus Micrarchaeota archaeon]